MSLHALIQSLGIRFPQPQLLQQALTHASFAHLHGLPSNERLEFLGDAILGAIIAQALYQQFPALPEGDLTRLRAQCIQGSHLASAARRLSLQDFLQHNLKDPSPSTLEHLLEQAFESLVAVIFLQHGYEPTRTAVLRWLPLPSSASTQFNPKGLLQELLQPRVRVDEIVYSVSAESGPNHARSFTVQLSIQGRPVSTGQGSTKKSAEEAAAAIALQILKAKID